MGTRYLARGASCVGLWNCRPLCNTVRALRLLSQPLRTHLCLPTPPFCAFLVIAEAGNPVTPAPHVPFEHRVEATPYIQELSSEFSAVSTRVVLRGQCCFYHNEMCRKLFLSSEAANDMYSTNKQARRTQHSRVFFFYFLTSGE